MSDSLGLTLNIRIMKWNEDMWRVIASQLTTLLTLEFSGRYRKFCDENHFKEEETFTE